MLFIVNILPRNYSSYAIAARHSLTLLDRIGAIYNWCMLLYIYRAEKWLQFTGQAGILKERKFVVICSRHFEMRMFLNSERTRLHRHAIPSILQTLGRVD